MYYDEPYLAHYGVKGMKWGVRREKAKAAVNRAKKRFYEGHGGKQFLATTIAGNIATAGTSALALNAARKGNLRAFNRYKKANRVAATAQNAAAIGIIGKSVHKSRQKKKQQRR